MEFLAFFNFAVDEGLNDRPQEFLGNDIHHLRAHFIQNALYDRLN